jgi:hypothetical protein
MTIGVEYLGFDDVCFGGVDFDGVRFRSKNSLLVLL